MNTPQEAPCRSLREMELAVEAEMREWGRRRLQEKLQAEADRHGRVFPPQPATAAPQPGASDAPAHQRGRD